MFYYICGLDKQNREAQLGKCVIFGYLDIRIFCIFAILTLVAHTTLMLNISRV